jgi:hypothetical protein
MSRYYWRWLLLLTATIVAGRAGAQEVLRPDLRDISKAVAAVVRKEGQAAVSLGPFRGRFVPASAGAGIQKIMAEELAAVGILVNERASLEVSGRYIPLGEQRDFRESKEILGLLISVTISDAQGTPLAIIDGDIKARLEKTVKDREVVAQVLGVTHPDEGGNRTPEEQGRDLKKRIDKPAVTITGSRIKAEPKGNYAIEVQVLREGMYVPLTPTNEGGFAFVQLQKTDVFAVHVINDSDFEAAVELAVDGLSNFAFFEKKGYRHLVVPPRKSYLIKGWQRTPQSSDEFVITDYAKGAVKELGASSDGIGTITASFAAAWDPRYDPNIPERSKLARRPPDDQSQPRDINDLAAGRGKPVASPVIEAPREIGRRRDMISVRYKKPDLR